MFVAHSVPGTQCSGGTVSRGYIVPASSCSGGAQASPLVGGGKNIKTVRYFSSGAATRPQLHCGW